MCAIIIKERGKNPTLKNLKPPKGQKEVIMTYRDFYNAIVSGDVVEEGFVKSEYIDFAKEAIVKLDNRNASRKNSAKARAEAEANNKLKGQIEDILRNNTEVYAVSEIVGLLKDVNGVDTTIQKVSRLVKEIDGVVVTDDYKVGGKGSKVKGYSLTVETE